MQLAGNCSTALSKKVAAWRASTKNDNSPGAVQPLSSRAGTTIPLHPKPHSLLSASGGIGVRRLAAREPSASQNLPHLTGGSGGRLRALYHCTPG